jgi:Tol biopolymer transport system component
VKVGWTAFLCIFILGHCVCSTKSYGQISELAVSPEGKTIVVTYQKGHSSFIYKIALNTREATRFTHAVIGEESSPAFSTDGKLVAYAYYVPKNLSQRIIVRNVDGSGEHSIAASGTANVGETFAPDGKKIYFLRSLPPPLNHAWDIYSVNTDGSDIQRLTHGTFYRVSQPSISPDGKSMVVMTIGADAHRHFNIYSLEHPRQAIQVVQPRVPKEVGNDPLIDYPNFMPDAKSILFMAATNGKRGFDYDVYRLTLATGIIDRLTNGNGIASNLRVFADGKTAAFLKWHKNWRGTPDVSEIYLLDLETRKLRPFEIAGIN